MTTAPASQPTQPTAAPVSAPAIELEHAARWYGNVVAVNDVSFSLGAGVTGLLGPNGAGKTTLLHMLAGFLAPSAGEVRILGRSPHRDPSVYRQIGLVPEREAVYPFLTGLDYVKFNARLQGLSDAAGAARAAIARVGLEDAMDRQIGTYSKGMRQRVKVAGSLVNSPTISSRISSRVTSPAMSPYSSTTNARRRRVRWNCASCCVRVVPSGTK